MTFDRRVQILSSWCAASRQAAESLFPRLVAVVPKEQDKTWREMLEIINATNLVRMLTMVRSRGGPDPLDLSRLTFADSQVLWDGVPIGKIHTYYKTVLPYEAQARVAYDVFYDGFTAFIGKQYKVAVLQQSDFDLDCFIPNHLDFDIEQAWRSFIQLAFGSSELYAGVGQMLNTFKLVEREPGGFGFLFQFPSKKYSARFPVPSRDLADFISALYYAVLEDRVLFAFSEPVRKMRQVAGKMKEWEHKLKEAQSDKSREAARVKLEEWCAKLSELEQTKQEELGQNRERLTQYDEELAKQIGATKLHSLKHNAQRYNRTARRQFGPGTVKPDGLLREIMRIERGTIEFELSPLLTAVPSDEGLVRSAGDGNSEVCYACGRVWPPDRLLKASMLVINPSSQRTQSGRGQVEPPICDECYSIGFVSPIKTGTSHLVIHLEAATDQSPILAERLRGWVMGEFGIVAGRYLLLTAQEKYGKNEKVAKKLGGVQYALYRVASEFTSDVFQEFRVTALVGSSEVLLTPRHLAYLDHLVEIFGLKKSKWPANSREDKAQFAAFGRAIRHIQREEVIFAIYELLAAGLVALPLNMVRASQLEQLRAEHVRWLEMDHKTNRAQFFKDVAAMTGLLYPFCDYVRREVHKAGGNERIEVRKVIERSGDPYQVSYTVAGNTRREMATLYRSADLHFSYDQLKAFLGQLGIDPAEREATDDKGQLTLRLYFDDIVEAYTHLFERRYKTTKEQRDFTYELKLSLYARFADLIESEKKGE